MNRTLKNFGKVLRGRGIAAICGVMGTALMANALPVEQFGLVILLHTYVMVIKGFLNFRSFEAIVRFGIPHHESGDEGKLRKLLRSTMLLDFTSSGLATLVAVAAVPLAASILHWEADMTRWATLYSLVLLTTPINTGSGILRLYDRFDALGIQYTVGPIFRLILVSIAWAFDASMWVFLLAWGTAFCVGNLYMIIRGLVELRRNMETRLWQGFRWGDIRDQGREFWSFIGVVYWQTSVDLLPKHLSTLLVGSLLGPAAAGLFRLARDAATVLNQPAVLLREVMFPDLTRSWNSKQDGFARSAFETALIAGSVGLVFVALAWIGGESILALVGQDYVPAKTLMVLLLLGGSFELASASLRAAAYAMGLARSVLRIHLIGIGTYLALFYVFTSTIGLNGPGFASIVTLMLTLSLTVRLVAKHPPPEA
jgi:O-antigen/teichoic acid export membrane protein